MKFYFYLYGKKTGQLKLYTKRKNSKEEIRVFKQYGNHGHKWNFAQVFLDFAPSDIFQVNMKFSKNLDNVLNWNDNKGDLEGERVIRFGL